MWSRLAEWEMSLCRIVSMTGVTVNVTPVTEFILKELRVSVWNLKTFNILTLDSKDIYKNDVGNWVGILETRRKSSTTKFLVISHFSCS